MKQRRNVEDRGTATAATSVVVSIASIYLAWTALNLAVSISSSRDLCWLPKALANCSVMCYVAMYNLQQIRTVVSLEQICGLFFSFSIVIVINGKANFASRV